MAVFGLLPSDVVTNARGDVVFGAGLTLYASEADANSGGNPLASVTTGPDGRWMFSDDSRGTVWIKTNKGDVYVTFAPESLANAGVSLSVLDEKIATQHALDSSMYAHLSEPVNVVSASGASQVIPSPSIATMSRLTLTANCVLTFPAIAAGKSFTLSLIQGAPGARLVTWPASVKWPGGIIPDLSIATNARDILTFVCDDGLTWAGFMSGQDMR